MGTENDGTSADWKEETSEFVNLGGSDSRDAELQAQYAAQIAAEAKAKAGDDADQEKPAAAADATTTEADADAAAAAAVEGGETKPGELPDWLKKRADRATKKETEAEKRVREAEERAKTAEDELAAERAAKAAPAPTKAPDPDDFDTVIEYEQAKTAYEAAQKKPEPKVEEKPKGGPTPPPGMDLKEYTGVENEVRAALTPETLELVKKMPALNEALVVAIHDVADGDTKGINDVAEFLAKNPNVAATILALPARKQSATLERVFIEARKPSKPGNGGADDTAPPIDRGKQRGGGAPYGGDFTSFEEARNREEAERGPI